MAPPDARHRIVLAGLAAVGIGALAACFPSADPDLWFHLALGRQMAQEGMPTTETICVLSRGSPFTNHEWLWDLLLYGAWRIDGLRAVLTLRAVSAGLLFGLCWALAVRLGSRPFVALWVLLLAVPVVRPWLGDRPHVSGYAMAAAMALLVLDRRPLEFRRMGLLWGLTVLWTNLHGSFPLAVASMILPWLHRETWKDPGTRKRWMVALVGTSLVTLVNPWGPRLHRAVAHHGEKVHRMLAEWAPWSFAEDPARDVALLILVGGAAAGFLERSRRRALDEVALLILFLGPFWISEKFAPGLLVGAVPVLAVHLSRPIRPWPRVVRGLSLALVLALGGLARPGLTVDLSLDEREMPKEAVTHAREVMGVRGPVFHPFNVGGYLAFWGHPQIEPLLDGRVYIHGEEGVAAYLGALESYDRFRALVRGLGIHGVLVDRQDASFQGLIGRLEQDRSFGLAWIDDRFAWFLPADRVLDPYRVLRASTDPRHLLELSEDQASLAQVEADRVRRTGRGEETWSLVKGMLALREAGLGWSPGTVFRSGVDPAASAEAAEVFGTLGRLRPDVPMFAYFHALALIGSGRCPEARETLMRARVLPDARTLLDRIEREGCPAESRAP